MLEDYPLDTDEPAGTLILPACPGDFSPRAAAADDTGKLLQRLQDELAIMRTWHQVAASTGKRSTFGVSGLSLEQITALFDDFLCGKPISLPAGELAELLRLATEDLKACYFEAVSAQPGQTEDWRAIADWFWGTTCAAAVINEIRRRCLAQPDRQLVILGQRLLVPRSQQHRFQP